tara:strand:- start:93 stop:299 length:207 start_codon:yes stop_codon:yes gene_type:complete
MLYHFGFLSTSNAIMLGLALFAAIFGYTSVMDQYKWGTDICFANHLLGMDRLSYWCCIGFSYTFMEQE